LTLGFGAFVLAMVLALKIEAVSLFWFLVVVFAVTAGFLALAKAKTDGEWRWR
jgi:hypothetical protein